MFLLVRGRHSSIRQENRVFLNPLFGEPVVCTPDSCGFRHFWGFRDISVKSALNSLFVAVWVVFVVFVIFVISVVFVKGGPHHKP